MTTTYGYDSAGRVTSASQPEPGGGTLTTGYAYPSGVQTTVTLPTNATQVTTLYLDGKEKGGLRFSRGCPGHSEPFVVI